MKKSLRLLFLSFYLLLSSANFNLNSASALSYDSTEAICNLIGKGCEVVSETEINLRADSPLVLGEEEIPTIFKFDSLTINFYTQLELKSELTLVGNYVFNDFNETGLPTIYANYDDSNVFNLCGKLTLNNISLESVGETVAFRASYGAALTINGGTYKAKALIVAGNDQEIVINDGDFEANNFVLTDSNRAKSVLIKDGNFKSNSGAVMPVVFDAKNIEIVSGTFEASKENSDAEIFQIAGSTSEEESKKVIKNIIAKDSEVYDLENETLDLSYRNIYIDKKGETDFGFLNTKKILVRATGGMGGKEPEPDTEEEPNSPAEPETPDSPETPEETPSEPLEESKESTVEESESEENPRTLIDHPFIYFTGVTLATIFGFLSLKKYLDL